jgi:hypothetical protein
MLHVNSDDHKATAFTGVLDRRPPCVKLSTALDHRE